MPTIRDRLGCIDVLFVNAGMGVFVPVETFTEQLWDQVMDVNLKGIFPPWGSPPKRLLRCRKA